MESQPNGRDARSGGLTPLHEALARYLRRCSDAYLRCLKRFAVLNVDRHAQPVRNRSVRADIVFSVKPGERRDIKAHLPALRLGGIGFRIVLRHAKDRSAKLINAPGVSMDKKIGPNRYFNS